METSPILTQKLHNDSETPLYAQLIGIIKRVITSGEADVGQLLPSEAELCKAYGISRNTVRQAIGALEEDGFVVRKRGKGTFVADPTTRRKSVQYSFTTEVSQMGKNPSSTLVNFDVLPVSPRIREIMELPADARVYCFTRVRNVDNKPLIVETSYYPEYIYPNLTREMLQTHSFYSLLYHVGVVPASAEDTYEAVLLGDREAALLDCRSDIPAFFHQRRTTGEDGRIYEYTTSYMRADRMKLNVHFQKGATEFTRVIDQ
ncbi:MAG: GntR family transcriptional regulator [Oscillospiraceae bacterium]|nr:GntR family transcriptional regulator [Oscillospiraceae bacterium]